MQLGHGQLDMGSRRGISRDELRKKKSKYSGDLNFPKETISAAIDIEFVKLNQILIRPSD